ncbi:MAG: amylo-alpha-1,6-glucosidase [Acidimicrobiales bacterium]
MTSQWTYAGKVTALDPGGGAIILVDESTFAISNRAGDIIPGTAQGLFVQDKRVLSRLEFTIDGSALEALAAINLNSYSATFVTRTLPSPGRADSTLMIFRTRYVGQGMREDVIIHNFGDEAAVCVLEGFIDSDFADLFAVKEGRAGSPEGEFTRSIDGNSLTIAVRRGAVSRGVRLEFNERQDDPPPLGVIDREGPADRISFAPELAEDHVRAKVVVPAKGEWSGCVEVIPIIESSLVLPRFRCGQPIERAAPTERLAHWRQMVPHVETDHDALRTVIAQSAEDLGALRMFDPDFPERVVVAAGAPWFMTVFGRDSLLTAWSALIVDPSLALGVLQTLARFQGQEINAAHEEEPGRILHEMRFGDAPSLSLGGGSIYYGTADATPLFVMLLGELRRWGLAREQIEELMPNADRAMAWIQDFGDIDGDGYVECHRATDRGLANQGWKDSWDGVRYADGRIAEAPTALCEVQAYVYAAYLARARFALEAGEGALSDTYRIKAATLKTAFNRDFWLEDRAWFAIGLDRDKSPIDSLTSNMGHCLWTGIVDDDKAQAVARHLLSDEMFSGWGVRTLATSMGGYNPVSYHCGSVWPHDTAIAVAGLARYGFEEGAQRLVLSLLDAGMAQGGRLPELFSGLGRNAIGVPVGYPTSCSPQAWSAASPLLCLRTLLRFDPQVPDGKTWLAPMIPGEIGSLRVEGIPLAGSRITVEIENGNVEVSGLPEHIELIETPRHPHTAL